MKKALALLMAIATACTISIGAFAADTDIFDSPAVMSSLEWASGTTDANPLLKIDKDQIVLGYSAEGMTRPAVVVPEMFLKAGTEYTYQLYRVDKDYSAVSPGNVDMSPITEAMLNGGKLRIRSAKGSSNVVGAEINKKGSGGSALYRFKIETKHTYGTKVVDLEYNITVSGQAVTDPNKLLDANILLQTGYRSIPQEIVDDSDEGDIITISEDRPVITAKQFTTLAKNFNFKPVEITNEEEDWRYIGRVSGMGSANFLTSYDVVPEIVNNYPDNDYKFLTFNAGVTFPTSGEMRIDVSDFDVPGSQLFAYLYRDGELTPITTTFDGTTDELVFRTNYLGSFLVTSTEIEDLGTTEPGTDTEPTQPNNNNPPMGASTTASMAVAFGLVSLAAAGIINRKRK